MFSHDSQGLGHTRRSIEIAAALERGPGIVDCLLITGAPSGQALALDPNLHDSRRAQRQRRRTVHDPVATFALDPDVTDRIRYTGYVSRARGEPGHC